MTTNRYIVGVDIGGTFTDFCMVDRTTGKLYTGKQLTTPHDPSEAFLEGVNKVIANAEITLADVRNISHATTLVTNSIIERKGAATAFLVTKGHRDVLIIGREQRYDQYDIRLRRPEPLVPRYLTREVDERIGSNGQVMRVMQVEQVRQAINELVAEGAESVAVCLLHSYRNPDHEKQIKALIEAEFPALICSISSEVAPELREFDRASTVVANAFVRPRMQRYLMHLQQELARRGFDGHLHMMLSNGGITTVEASALVPIRAIESGPAAGALAASLYGRLIGYDRILAFDMGGTTAKISFSEQYEPRRANRFEAARVQRFKKGSGFPLLIPVIELIEIGAGGGSIARVDNLGLLKVGPTSASARPGPAAYGQGGEEPTVTDADVVLGYIAPDRFLGGEMQLDRGAAERAIETRIGKELGRDLEEVAWGIYSVVNENMAMAAKLYAAEQGIDVRSFTMIAFGGAGPIHAYRMAQVLGIRTIVYPFGAGVASALGLCAAPPATDLARSYVCAVSRLEWDKVEALFAEMEQEAMAAVCAAGAKPEEITMERSAEMRFSGQGYEVEISLKDIPFNKKASAKLRAAFDEAYRHQFGRVPEGDVEVLTWRLKAGGQVQHIDLAPFVKRTESAVALVGERQAYFWEFGGYRACPVYDRYALAPGQRLTGPAMVEERETTVVIGPGASIEVDSHLNLIVTLPETNH